MRRSVLSLAGLAAVSLGIVGCGNGAAPPATTATSDNTESAVYVTKSEPAGAVAVGEARQSAKDKDEVVLVGRIGGSVEPFVDGLAAFTIVDPKVPYCSDDEGCPTPWDYCCEQDQVKENIATIKVVDANGKPVAKDARELLGVKELNVVVVQGKAQRDADGNLSVLADQVFVKN